MSLNPGSGSALTYSWIRIRIETNAAPQHSLYRTGTLLPDFFLNPAVFCDSFRHKFIKIVNKSNTAGQQCHASEPQPPPLPATTDLLPRQQLPQPPAALRNVSDLWTAAMMMEFFQVSAAGSRL
jgi:hypothetical protein